MANYKPTIGIETHVQLNTKTKLFSAVGNDAREAPPNTLISHIDAGLPGALPVLNERALELACRTAFALNTKPQKFSKFDRKHYFYPDLPKGYQITQYEDPIILSGYVELPDGAQIRITRVHLEEDAGKNSHPVGADYSLVDLNRAGTPLLEIVSEPDIHSAADAKAYARELWLIMKYAGVTDGDLYHGHVRFDVNVSVSKTDEPGTRAEVKNLNSFRSVEAAVEYEIKRQAELLEKGEKIVQETRGWDEAKQKTTSQRGKEEAEDYRYMPEPDIPPLELDHGFIEKIRKEMPETLTIVRKKLKTLEVSNDVIENILDRPEKLRVVMQHLENAGPHSARRTLFLLIHIDDDTDLIKLEPERMSRLAELVDANQISAGAARVILEKMAFSDASPMEIAKEMNLVQVSDQDEIKKIVVEVLVENEKAAEDVKNGEEKAIGFLVGQVMAKSKGQANPQIAQELIKKQLNL